MRFTNREKKDLFYAGVMISLAFAILLSGGISGIFGNNLGFLTVFIIAFFTAGIGFLLHELSHKYIAISYGLNAEFKAFYGDLTSYDVCKTGIINLNKFYYSTKIHSEYNR